MLKVGVDTYVTLDEANEYVNNYFLSSDPLRIQWNAMEDSDREVLLRKAFVQMNQLPYTGKPKNPKQSLPFPRGCTFTTEDWQLVKNAQVEQCVAISDPVAIQDFENRIKIRRAGVVKYTIGDLSEQFQSGLPSESNATFFGLAEKAYGYLSKWLRGGYKVCTSIKRHYGYPWWWLP